MVPNMTINVAQRIASRSPLHSRHSLSISVASTPEEITQCLRLRYEIFTGEMGAKLDTLISGLDCDRYDEFARHLVIRDMESEKIVGTTRLISVEAARQAGSYYSESEFDLSAVLALNANLLEVGRTCIAESHRNGAVLSLLWKGIARITEMENIDYLIGCASIPLSETPDYAHAIMNMLRENHTSDITATVTPRHPLPIRSHEEVKDVILPTLLKGYIRLGSKVSAEACYDPDFNVADVFILLDRDNIEKRYSRHFLERA
jgi:putative hemolysin